MNDAGKISQIILDMLPTVALAGILPTVLRQSAKRAEGCDMIDSNTLNSIVRAMMDESFEKVGELYQQLYHEQKMKEEAEKAVIKLEDDIKRLKERETKKKKIGGKKKR